MNNPGNYKQLPLWTSAMWRKIKLKKIMNSSSQNEMPLWTNNLWRKRMLKKIKAN